MPRLQQFPGVERHDGVKAGLPLRRQLDHMRDPGTGHPRADPCLANEGGVEGGDRGDLRFGEFQHHRAAIHLVNRTEQAAVAAVGHQNVQHESVHRVADLRHRNQRQAHDGGADIIGARRRQCHDVQHERGAVVGAAGLERRLDQRSAGILGRRTHPQDVGDAFVHQRAMHAVGAQQEAIVQRDRMAGVIQAKFRFDAECAGEHRRIPTAVAHVVGGQAQQAIAAQTVGARVADMQQMRETAAQHQRGECAAHADEVRVLLPLGVDPGVERVEDAGPGAPHLHGLGHVPEAVEEAAHRGLRRHAAAFGAADAVGDGGRHVASLRGKLGAKYRAGEILIARSRTGGREVADACPRGCKIVAHPARLARSKFKAAAGNDRAGNSRRCWTPGRPSDHRSRGRACSCRHPWRRARRSGRG